MKTGTSPVTLTLAADRALKKLALIICFLPPLLEAIILFPLTQIAVANSGEGVLYQILSTASHLVSLAGYFGAIALAVYCIFAVAHSALGRVVALQSISILFAEVLIRILMLWLLALINDSHHPALALSNYTLNTLSQNDGQVLVALALYFFMSALTKLAILLIIIAIALLIRRRIGQKLSLSALVGAEGEQHPRITLALRIATLLYLLQALANQIFNTVSDISGVKTDVIIAHLGQIIAPYFLLAIYAFVGYQAMQFTVRRISAHILEICRTKL